MLLRICARFRKFSNFPAQERRLHEYASVMRDPRVTARAHSQIRSIVVASLSILLSGGDCAAGLRLKLPGGRFQIGDLVFQIPETQTVTGAVPPRPDDYSDYPPDRLDKSAELIKGLSIDGPDAFRPSETHSRAKGPKDSVIQIILEKMDRARETDYWCRKGDVRLT